MGAPVAVFTSMPQAGEHLTSDLKPEYDGAFLALPARPDCLLSAPSH